MCLRRCHAVLAVVLLAGCGGGGHNTKPPQRRAAAPPGPCEQTARATVARFLALAPGSIATKTGTGNNGMPQCTFTARAKHATVTANLDNGPQIYFRLERAIVEESQQFATVRQVAAPQHVAHLGLDASWFPAEHQLLTADKKTLITVIVSWRHAREKRQRALARDVARAYLTASQH